MRLFYFTEFALGNNEGGCLSHVEGIVHGLHKIGWDVTLYFARENKNDVQSNYPFRHILIKRKRVTLVNQLKFQIRLLWTLFCTKVSNPDVIYMRTGFLMLAPVVFALVHKIPYFYEVNGIQSNETGYPKLVKIAEKVENWAMKHSRGIFCVTEELKKYFMLRTGLPEDRFAVVPNGADPGIWPPKGRKFSFGSGQSLTIGFIGHFQKRQGVETILKALPKIREKIANVCFIVAGSGPQESWYKKTAADLGISEYVEFPGFITKENLSSFLAAMGVVVAPYTLEFGKGRTGLSPIKMFTYLACERIVVASELSGLQDFRQCEAVRFARPDDPEDFANAIVEVLQMTPAERAEIGKKARQYIMEGFTWDKVAIKTADFIREKISVRK